MSEISVVLLFIMWLRVVAASYYFHEPSRLILKPDPLKEYDTFGFSMGYQRAKSSLIVGAPQSDLTGNVFQCHLGDNLDNKTEYCQNVNIDVEKLAPYKRDYTPNLKLNLGVSIAATTDYFFTCAPLWPATPTAFDEYYPTNFSYGTCFMYNGTAHRYSGMFENHERKPGSVSHGLMFGGVGWRTLVDEANEILFVAKMALLGDVVYMNSSHPLEPARSLIAIGSDKTKRHLYKYLNLGNAIVAGKFFSTETVHYAISAMTSDMQGIVHFLKVHLSKSENITKVHLLKFMKDMKLSYVNIFDNRVGSMFGAAMDSADLNEDGTWELLVGAPAEDGGESVSETGAVHIYIGGDLRTINEENRHRVIVGNEESSRFGTAIATTDVDADNLPEIVVSAPYENGVGAVYILSGYEIMKTVINGENYKRINLNKLRRTQKIMREEFRTFGYSFQKIPDMNDNGCNELAIGAPGSNAIVLMRCISAVNVSISANLVGAKIVQEQDSNFTVKVCINIKHLMGKNFTIELKVNNEVIGNGALIEESQTSLQWTISGNTKEESRCEDVVVKLNDNEPGEYSFSTKLEIDDGKIKNSTDKFNDTWVMVSPESTVDISFDVSRHCTGKDCEPNLSVEIEMPVSDHYQLGTSEKLSASLRILNSGNSSFEACVLVHTSGAPVSQIDCGNHFDGYKCYMPRPLKRKAQHTIHISFNMSQPSNQQRQLHIQATLYEFCNQANIKDVKKLVLPYTVNVELIVLKSSGHNQTVSDVEIKDVRVDSINDAHEYLIENKGSVTWKNINVTVAIQKQPFIQEYRISTYGCTDISDDIIALYNCSINIMPYDKIKIIATIVILKSKIVKNLKDGKLAVTSYLSLSLDGATSAEKIEKLTTVITWQKELSLAQNKQLIIFLAIVGALVALALVIFILYKMKFFKRKEKTKLEALKKEHIRRQSVKRSMSVATLDDDGLYMEVDDDSPFEIIDVTEPVVKQEDTKL